MSQEFAKNFIHFLSQSVTPYHAVWQMQQQLIAHNFQPLEDPWTIKPHSHYFYSKGGALAVLITGASPEEQGLRVLAAHTDSPCLILDPAAQLPYRDYTRLSVSVYGGALLNPWFDRDLGIAGRVAVQKEASIELKLIDINEPIAFIPSLAIHLDPTVNDKRSINKHKDIFPILSTEPCDLMQVIAEKLHCKPQDILSHELFLYDLQPPAVTGLNKEFIAGARLDNLYSCYTILETITTAIQQKKTEEIGPTLALFYNHEEIGSCTHEGALSPLMERIINQWLPRDRIQETLEKSLLLSIDNSHAIHPNYPEKHDNQHSPIINKGPAIKQHANKSYATDLIGTAYFKMWAKDAGVPIQEFIPRNDMRCGSTVGPLLSSNVGINGIDIGLPSFAMHSIRETAGIKDGEILSDILHRALEHLEPLSSPSPSPSPSPQ